MSNSSHSLDKIAKHPLLSASEEIHHARAVQAMQKLLEFKPTGPYTKEERSILRFGKRSKERMIISNMRWVFTLARKYLPVVKSLTYEDLVQEGTIGLIRGVERFDPERGYRFTTYAYWWIRQAINKGLMADRMIRLPSNAIDCQRKIWDCRDHFLEHHQRSPSIEEIATYCGFTVDAVKLYISHSLDAYSLDQKVSLNGNEVSSISDLIACNRDTPWDHAEHHEYLEFSWCLLGKNQRKRHHIVNYLFGIPNEKPTAMVAACC